MIVLYVLYALIGITVIIFVHELGHFLAAKRTGVRVERFALGFDPPVRGKNLRLLSFRRGETEYVIGLVPFGGYVKLAGEAIAERGKTPAPDELLAKSPGKRALIFAAGSAMNMLSGFVFFIVAFTIGVSFTSSDIGVVEPGGPAWTAGVRPGDTVLELDGERVTDFFELRLGVALSQRSRPIAVKVSRPAPGGEPSILDLQVTPRSTSEGFNDIGVSPAISAALLAPPKGSALETAGIAAGDRIVGAEVGGLELPDAPPSVLLDAVRDYRVARPADPIRLRIDRGGTVSWKEVRPTAPRSPASRPQLRIEAGRGNVVRAVRSGSPAAELLRPEDRVVAADGLPVATIDWTSLLGEWEQLDAKADLTVVRPTGERRTVQVPRREFLIWNLLADIDWAGHLLRVDEVEAGSPPAVAGLSAGDVVTHLDGKPCHDQEELRKAVEASREATESTVRVLRAGEPAELRLPAGALTAVKWNEMPAIGKVVPGGAAAAAGLSTGDRLLEAGGKKLRAWSDLLERIADSSVGDTIALRWVEPDGTVREAGPVLTSSPAETIEFPVEPVQVSVQAGPIESIALGAKRTVLVSKQVLLTLRSLLRRDVSPKNLAGPVGIVHHFTLVLQHSPFSQLLFWLALVSVNLGLLNLMPFPILDGGHLLFLAIEKVKGSPVDVRVQEWAINIAFFLILFLAVFVTFHDVRRLFL